MPENKEENSIYLDSHKMSGVILVAVSSSPSSANVIRWAVEHAKAIQAECIALSVETDRILSSSDRNRLDQNLCLSRTLGARVEIIHNNNVAETVIAFAQDCEASMIVIGRSGLSFRWPYLLHLTVSDKIVKEAGNISVTVIQDSLEKLNYLPKFIKKYHNKKNKSISIVIIILFLSLIFLGQVITPYISYRGLAMIYLIPVIGLSFFAQPKMIAMFAVLSSLALNYFFIPPLYTFAIRSLEDVLLFITYFFAAIVTGSLVAKLKNKENQIVKRQNTTLFLLNAAEKLTTSNSIEQTIEISKMMIKNQFGIDSCIYTEITNIVDNYNLQHFDKSVIKVEIEKSIRVGISELSGTDKFRLRIIPCGTIDKSTVLIGLELPFSMVWTIADDAVIASLGNLVGLLVSREKSDSISRIAQLELKSQRLAKVLLDSVSHEMRTPLTTVTGSLSALCDSNLAENSVSRKALLDGALEASATLNNVVEDLLSAGRIESGVLKLKKEKIEISEIQSRCLLELESVLKNRKLNINNNFSDNLVFVDFALTVRMICNLVKNSIKYSYEDMPIILNFVIKNKDFFITVCDSGPGVNSDKMPFLFEKFKRGDHKVNGLGLGLAICKGISEAHGGTIRAIQSSNSFTIEVIYPDCITSSNTNLIQED